MLGIVPGMRVLSRWIAVGLFALAPGVAMADIISDEEAQCGSEKVGEACTIAGEAGTCQKSTCSRNDYSEGVPPKTKQVECMVCKPGAAPPEPVAEEKDSAKAEEDKDAKADSKDAKADSKDDASKDAKAGSQDEASSKSGGGCTVGGPAPLGLGLLLLGGVFWMRRRG